ncbi:hypothetical protein [Parasphingorhabdus sp.]
MKPLPTALLASGLLLGCADTGVAADKPRAAVTHIAELASPYLDCTAKLDVPENAYIPIRGPKMDWEGARKKLAAESGQPDTPCGLYETHARIVDRFAPDYSNMARVDLEHYVFQTMDQLRKLNRGIYLWKDGSPSLPMVAPPPRVQSPIQPITSRDGKNAKN